METNDKGRPTKYKSEYAKQAFKFCLLGATNSQLADFFEVNSDTIAEWRKRHKSFDKAIKNGKAKADADAAEGLYKRATGFSYDEVQYEKILIDEVDEKGQNIKAPAYKKKVITKLLAPDPGAAMNWLSNRQPELWRSKQTIEMLDKLSDDQVNFLYDKLMKQLTENNDGK